MATDSVYALWGVLHRLGAPEWVSPSLVEFGTNILLFFPLGFLGPTLKPEWRWGNWLLTGFVATTAIELSQYFFLSARSAAVSDVVANTLGAVGGYLLVVLLRRR